MKRKRSEWNEYFSSFNLLNLDAAAIILFEIVFCGVMYLLGILFYSQILKILQNLSSVNLNQAVMLAKPEVITENIDLMYSVMGQVSFYLILLAISSSFVFAFFNLFVWSRIASKRLSQKFITNWIIKDFLWFLSWFALFIGSLFLFDFPFVVFWLAGLFFLFLHFNLHFNIVLAENASKVLIKTLKQATVKLPEYLIPYGLMILTYAIITFILGKVLQLANLESNIIVIAYFILAFTWIRFYLFKSIT